MPSRNKIFISYSHKDQLWLERINTHLKPLVRVANFEIWDDTKIRIGTEWKKEITNALSTSRVAILLVSPNFLASDFIYENELPHILAAVEKNEIKLFWILLSQCLHGTTDLVKFQSANNLKKPLDSLPAYKQNDVLTTICKNIENAYLPENKLKNNLLDTSEQNNHFTEVAPDDWSSVEGSLISRIKNFFNF